MIVGCRRTRKMALFRTDRPRQRFGTHLSGKGPPISASRVRECFGGRQAIGGRLRENYSAPATRESPTRNPRTRARALVTPPPAMEELQMDPFLGIRLSDDGEDLSHLNLDAEFLRQFAPQAIRVGFRRPAFAPGKFPQASQMIAQSSPRNKQPAAPEHDPAATCTALGHVAERLRTARSAASFVRRPITARCSCK